MVEARYERSPSYFKQFQKQFIFKIVDQKPTDITNSINYTGEKVDPATVHKRLPILNTARRQKRWRQKLQESHRKQSTIPSQ